MEIVSIAQLKKWFQRGLYPTQEQFHAWLDSFWHKEEKIDVQAIDRLPALLNEKYATADGQALENAHKQLTEAFERHKTEANEAIDQLREQLQQFRGEVETTYIKKTDTVILDGGTPEDLL